MTDLTPAPQGAPAGLATLSHQDVMDLEQKVRENKAAQLRGEPPPHNITREQLRDAVMAIRRNRGTMNLKAPEGGKKGAKGKATVIEVDIDEL